MSRHCFDNKQSYNTMISRVTDGKKLHDYHKHSETYLAHAQNEKIKVQKFSSKIRFTNDIKEQKGRHLGERPTAERADVK